MSDAALITIGITSFNARDTILRAVRSALEQDWLNTEIIVVDDCSEDDSVGIVEKATADVPRLRLVRHAVNRGTAGARNTILAKANGEFIAFFDDDDESRPERIRLQYEALRDYEKTSGISLIACYASGARRYSNGYELDMPAIGSRPVIPHGDMVVDYLLFNARRARVFYGSGTPTCALMARRSTFRAVGGFDESLRRVEDVDFAIRLALAGGHFIGCASPLFLQYATVAADKTPRANLDAELRLVEKHSAYLKRHDRYDYARAWFLIRFYHFNGQRYKFITAVLAFLLRHPISGTWHMMRSFPARWMHERNMRALFHAQ